MISRNRWARAAALGAASTFLVAACGGGSSGGGATSSPAGSAGPSNAAPGDQVTLKINFWGNFGLKELVTKYEADHPNIKIQLNPGDYNAQHEALTKSLIAGSGAPDIAAIDEGFTVGFRAQSDKFVNLLDNGFGSYEPKYLSWKWKQTLSQDGKTQFGAGTDFGNLKMCYRTDLFKAANMPTDRDEVSTLWPTWDAFAETAKRYTAATGKKFVDAASNIMNPVLGQQQVGYFDTSDKLAMDGGPKVAWDTATKFITDKTSANLVTFSAEWDAAFKNGAFAAVACPAWMLGYIKDKAPDTAGKWDIASVPGGTGNWGGSFWTIPKQGKHTKEAYDLVTWLVAPEQQIAIFKTVGNLPAQPALFTDPALMDNKNPFFNDAPTGKIFTTNADKVVAQYLGKKNGPVRVEVEKVLVQVQQGKVTPEAGWTAAKAAAEKAAK